MLNVDELCVIEWHATLWMLETVVFNLYVHHFDLFVSLLVRPHCRRPYCHQQSSGRVSESQAHCWGSSHCGVHYTPHSHPQTGSPHHTDLFRTACGRLAHQCTGITLPPASQFILICITDIPLLPSDTPRVTDADRSASPPWLWASTTTGLPGSIRQTPQALTMLGRYFNDICNMGNSYSHPYLSEMCIFRPYQNFKLPDQLINGVVM